MVSQSPVTYLFTLNRVHASLLSMQRKFDKFGKMRFSRASSLSTPEPLHRNLVAPLPTSTASTGCLLLLLASPDASTTDGTAATAPAASLLLSRESPFATRACSLRCDADEEDTARQLLHYAAREVDELRAGGALLAEPATEADRASLERLGFAPAGVDEALWSLVERRDPAEPTGFSHATLRVSSIERSLAFWSLLHYAPSRTFSASGARCAWLSAPWTPLSLELIEVPEVVLRQLPAAQRTPSADALGPAHLCLDVTALGVALPGTLAALQRRSERRFGRTLEVLVPPHQQMMGDLVSEVAIVRAPDGVQLRLTQRAAVLDKAAIAPDWSLHGEAETATAEEEES